MFYVDSEGQRLKGNLFSVGSGSTFAYGVLDQVCGSSPNSLLKLDSVFLLPLTCIQGYSYDLSDEDAQELGRRSIIAAGHRDAFSGNTCNLYHVRENGWEFIGSSCTSTTDGRSS